MPGDAPSSRVSWMLTRTCPTWPRCPGWNERPTGSYRAPQLLRSQMTTLWSHTPNALPPGCLPGGQPASRRNLASASRSTGSSGTCGWHKFLRRACPNASPSPVWPPTPSHREGPRASGWGRRPPLFSPRWRRPALPLPATSTSSSFRLLSSTRRAWPLHQTRWVCGCASTPTGSATIRRLPSPAAGALQRQTISITHRSMRSMILHQATRWPSSCLPPRWPSDRGGSPRPVH
jgi:hypothetical protein